MPISNSSSRHFVIVGPMYPYRGGIAQYLETACDGLKHRGHTVDAITFTRQYPERLFPGKTQLDDSEREAPDAERLLDSINPITWRQTARRIARLQPDALIFKYWMSFFAPSFGSIARLAARRGIRTLAVVDNALPHERHLGDALLGRYFLGACDGFVVMSEKVEQDVESFGFDAPIRRISHPIYNRFGDPIPHREARARLDVPEDAPVLLFFGFIRRYKGLHVLLEAMPQIVGALPEVRLLVAGEFYEDEQYYRDLIRKYGLEDHICIHGDYLSDEEVALYFSAADVAVQPYLSATQSGVAQVAFQFEKPTIITDVGGLPEIIPHERAGLVVPPNDPSALAEAVIRFFREEMAERLTQGVREERKRYAWEPLYEALEDLLEAS